MFGAWVILAAATATGTTPAYFPPELTQPRMICDATRPAERTPVLSAHQAERFSAFLAAAGEPALAPGGEKISGTVLRFIWLRAFDAPIIIRVERRGKSAHLVATRLTGQGGYAVGTVQETVARDLDGSAVARLRAQIAASDVSQLPSGRCEREIVADGADWLFEIAERQDYHFVARRTGGEGSVRALGLLLLDLAGWGTEKAY